MYIFFKCLMNQNTILLTGVKKTPLLKGEKIYLNLTFNKTLFCSSLIHRNFVDKPEINFPYNSTIWIIFEKSISYSGNFESYHIVFNAFNLLRVSDTKNSLYLSEKEYPSCTQKIKVLLFILSLFFLSMSQF